MKNNILYSAVCFIHFQAILYQHTVKISKYAYIRKSECYIIIIIIVF